jgi:DNA-binding Xre family transcriptional regulator
MLKQTIKINFKSTMVKKTKRDTHLENIIKIVFQKVNHFWKSNFEKLSTYPW